MSPNYPSNYPDNKDATYPVSVERGKVIKLWFTDFKIEAESNCAYDWVQVVDADGTVLLEKACGMSKPKEIISRTNKLNIKFHSDANTNYAGFRAQFEPVSKSYVKAMVFEYLHCRLHLLLFQLMERGVSGQGSASVEMGKMESLCAEKGK